MNVRRIYEYALQREREGMDFFQRNAKRMSHAAAVEIFHELATEEQKHIEFIQRLLKSVEGGQPPFEGGFELAQEDLFSQRIGGEGLPLAPFALPFIAMRAPHLRERGEGKQWEQRLQSPAADDDEMCPGIAIQVFQKGNKAGMGNGFLGIHVKRRQRPVIVEEQNPSSGLTEGIPELLEKGVFFHLPYLIAGAVFVEGQFWRFSFQIKMASAHIPHHS